MICGLRHLFARSGICPLGVPQEDDFSPYAVVTVNMEFMNGNVSFTVSRPDAVPKPRWDCGFGTWTALPGRQSAGG